MWHLLDFSPILTFLVVLYVLYIVAVLMIYVTLTRDCEPRRNDSQPSPPVDFQVFLSPGPHRPYAESDRLFSREPYSYLVDPDRRLWAVHPWCNTVYARMLADASEKIRL